jgi:hypothetical protein
MRRALSNETGAIQPGAESAPGGETGLDQLAQFFADVTPMRIPVQVTALLKGGRMLKESALIEFGTANEVLFASALPLEFEDRVRLENSDGSLDTEACVVAVRYHQGRRSVAARFSTKVANWIIQR